MIIFFNWFLYSNGTLPGWEVIIFFPPSPIIVRITVHANEAVSIQSNDSSSIIVIHNAATEKQWSQELANYETKLLCLNELHWSFSKIYYKTYSITFLI